VLERKAALQAAGGQVEVVSDLDIEVPAGVQTVLKELITNSCKFRRTEVPLRIRISASLADGYAEIAVTDNGLGVSPDYIDKIFLPFQRLNGREFPGHGLGLATSRRLASGWGGSIRAESDSSGRFTIRVTAPVRGS
jgi:signal transduction histidine kinase